MVSAIVLRQNQGAYTVCPRITQPQLVCLCGGDRAQQTAPIFPAPCFKMLLDRLGIIVWAEHEGAEVTIGRPARAGRCEQREGQSATAGRAACSSLFVDPQCWRGALHVALRARSSRCFPCPRRVTFSASTGRLPRSHRSSLIACSRKCVLSAQKVRDVCDSGARACSRLVGRDCWGTTRKVPGSLQMKR